MRSQNQNGYVILEVLISTVIAAVLSTGLMTTIMQITDVQTVVDSVTSIYGRATIFQSQLEKDLMGAFVPAQYDLIQTKTGAQKDKVKPVDKIFWGESKGKGGRLDYFTFITTNPLEIFFGVKDVKLKPRVARVVYRLMPDSRQKNSYVLWRQEGYSDLHFDRFKQDAQGEMRSYPMIDGIQELSVKFILIEEKETGKGEKKEGEKRKVSYIYKRLPSWKDVEKKQEKEKKKEGSGPEMRPYPKLPQQVEFTLSLWDASYKKHRTFSFVIPIQSRVGEYEKPPQNEKEGEPQEKKEPDTQKTTPSEAKK